MALLASLVRKKHLCEPSVFPLVLEVGDASTPALAGISYWLFVPQCALVLVAQPYALNTDRRCRHSYVRPKESIRGTNRRRSLGSSGRVLPLAALVYCALDSAVTTQWHPNLGDW